MIELGLVAWLMAGTVFALWIRRRDRQRPPEVAERWPTHTADFEDAMRQVNAAISSSTQNLRDFAAAWKPPRRRP